MRSVDIGDIVFLRINNLVGYAVVYDNIMLCLVDADIFIPILYCDIILYCNHNKSFSSNQKKRIERIREDIRDEITLVGDCSETRYAIC